VFANTNLDAMQTHWAVVTALHVVLARPDQLDGSSLHAFCDGRGFALHVAVQHGATSEAATRHLRVKSDLLRLEAEDLRDGHLIYARNLGAGPGFGLVALEADGGVQRLHGTVRQIGKLKFRDNPVGNRNGVECFLIPAGGSHHADGAPELLELRPQSVAVRKV